jgi:hypothetical protein
MTPEEEVAERKRVDAIMDSNMARVKAKRQKEADLAAQKKAEAAKNQQPQPTAAGKALLNAPTGFQALVNVLGSKPEPKKKP